jgi:hypothetical protein
MLPTARLRSYLVARSVFVLLPFVGIGYSYVRGHPVELGWRGVAALTLASMTFVYYCLDQVTMSFDERSIHRFFRRPIRWVEVTEARANGNFLQIRAGTGSCRIDLSQFKNPRLVVELAERHVPLQAWHTTNVSKR